MTVLVRQANTDARNYASLQSALDSCPAGGRVNVVSPTTITETLTVPPGKSLWCGPLGVIRSSHTGVAVNYYAHHQGPDQRLRVEKTGSKWYSSGETTSVGVRIDNTYDQTFHFDDVTDFGDVGVQIGWLPLDVSHFGVAYCNFFIGYIGDNKVNLGLDSIFEGGVQGFVNSNTFYGGRLRHSSTSTDQFAGSAELRCGLNANTNTFVNLCMEGGRAVRSLLCEGKFNQWVSGRWELSGPIEFTEDSADNMMIGGYDMRGQDPTTPNGLEIIDNSAAKTNTFWGANGFRVRANSGNYGQRSGIVVTSDSDARSAIRTENSTGDPNFEVVGKTLKIRDGGGTLRDVTIDSSGRLKIGSTIVGTQT